MLRIYDVAIEVVRRLQPHVAQLRRRQASLADQLDRAGDSVVLGIAEGSRSVGKTRALHYARGAASMDEARACLELAVAKGHLRGVEPELGEMMRRVIGTLIKAQRA